MLISQSIIKVHCAHKTVCNCMEIPVNFWIYFTLNAKGEIRKQGRYQAGFYQSQRYRDQGDRSREQLFRPACSCGPQLAGCQNPGISPQLYCRATNRDISKRSPFKRRLKDLPDMASRINLLSCISKRSRSRTIGEYLVYLQNCYSELKELYWQGYP